MPYLFTTEKYADIVFTLGLSNSNATADAVECVEYERRYRNRRAPDSKTIGGTFQKLCETGLLPQYSFSVTPRCYS